MKKNNQKRPLLFIISILVSLIIGFVVGVLSVPSDENSDNEAIWKEMSEINEGIISNLIEAKDYKTRADEAIENKDPETANEMANKLEELTIEIKNFGERKLELINTLNQ